MNPTSPNNQSNDSGSNNPNNEDISSGEFRPMSGDIRRLDNQGGSSANLSENITGDKVVSPLGYSPPSANSSTIQPEPTSVVSGSLSTNSTGGSSFTQSPETAKSASVGGMGTIPPAPKKSINKKVALAAGGVLAIVILALGYTFAFYLPNQPMNVYKKAMSNTGDAVDGLIAYMEKEESKQHKGVSVDGNLKFKSKEFSLDSDIKGEVDGNLNSSYKINANIMGEKFTADIISKREKGNTSPDIYFKVNGIKNFLKKNQLDMFSNLDSQWISVDHTIIDSSIMRSKTEANATRATDAASLPTFKQTSDAMKKVQSVAKEYLFTDNESKAIFTNIKFVAKDTRDGRSANHYEADINKDNLHSYVEAVGKALDSSELNEWSKKENNGRNLSDELGIKSTVEKIKKESENTSFELWVDNETKLISDIKFYDSEKKEIEMIIHQGFTGGSQYPLKISIKDDKTKTEGSLAFTIDTKANKYTFGVAVKIGGASPTDISSEFSLVPNEKEVKVSVPERAISINDIMQQIFGGSPSAMGPNATSLPISPMTESQLENIPPGVELYEDMLTYPQIPQ